jgi:hypothetical protein
MSDHLRRFNCKFVAVYTRSNIGNVLALHIIFQSFKITISSEILESPYLFALRSMTFETHLKYWISNTQSFLMPDYLFKMKLLTLSDLIQKMFCTDCFQTVVGRAVLILFAKSMYFLPFIHNVFEQHSVLLLLLFRQV